MIDPESGAEGGAARGRWPWGVLLAVVLGGAGYAAYLASRVTPEEHLSAGARLLAQGDGKGAVIEFKNVLQSQPGNAEAHFQLGLALYRQGDFAAAEKSFARAGSGAYPKAKVVPALARTLLVLNQPERVLKEIAEVPEATPVANAAILALRARALLQKGDAEAARVSLDQADARAPGQADTLAGRAMLSFMEGRRDAALAFADQALAANASDVELWVLRGDILRAQARVTDALAAYGRALMLNAANIPARLATAQLQVETGQLDAAESSLRALRGVAPANLMGRYLEALVDQRRGRSQDARSKLQSVLASAPDFQAARLLAALVDLGLKHREEARSHLGKVLESAPDQPLARKLMAATLADLGETEQARTLLGTLEEAGSDPALLALGGQLALQRGEFGEASRRLEKAVTLAPVEPSLFIDLAASRMGAGDSRGALEALRKAAELDTRTARPDTLLILALIRDRQFDQALAAVDRLAQERPRDPLVPNLRGSILAAKDDRDGARAAFEQAVRLEPGYPPAGFNLARLDLQAGKPSVARARFQEIIKLHPQENRAWIGLAHIAELEGDAAGMVKSLRQAKAVDAKDPLPRRLLIRHWMNRKDFAQAQSEAREAVDAGGEPAFLEAVGLAQLARQDNAGALMSFAQWLKLAPGEPRAAFRLAQAQRAARDTAAALATLDRLATTQPGFSEGLLLKALVLGEAGRGEEALKLIHAVQARHPELAAGYATEADLLIGLGRRLDAARLYDKAAQLSGRGDLLARATLILDGAGKRQESEERLKSWLRGHPGDVSVSLRMAQVMRDAGRGPEAETLLAELARKNPGDVAVLNNLAYLRAELKRPDALATAEKAYRLAPDNPATLDTLGWILVNAGQSRKGFDLLEQALAKAPNAPEVRWHLAAGLAGTGDRLRAKRELERLFATGLAFPQEDEARKLLDSLR